MSQTFTISGTLQAGVLGQNPEYFIDRIAQQYGLKVLEFKNYGGFLIKSYRFKLQGPERNVCAAFEELESF